MKTLDRFRLQVARVIAPRNQTITSSRQLMDYLNGGAGIDSDTGFPVTPETAMRLAAVFSCVRVVSEDIAALPLKLYRTKPRGREEVTDHWLAQLLEQPNGFQTGFEFREMEQAHLELSGMFFALKTILRGEIVELLPTSPARWCVELDRNWKLLFKFTFPDGEQKPVPAENVYFQRGLSLNGFTGVSPIEFMRETIGFGQALTKYGSRLFRNGANVGGVLEHQGTMSDPAYERLKASFEEKYAGLDNAHKVVLLEEGTKFTVTGMKADDAQFLESRKLNRSEICGIYRVPPHFIGDLERATFSNVEQQGTDYVQKGIVPRVRRKEARMKRALIPEADRGTMYIEHNVDGLLRGDFETRQRGYQTAVLTGWMSRAEVREKENMNPAPDDAKLDEFLVPGNELLSQSLAANADAAKQQKQQNDPPAPPKGAERTLKRV